MNTCRAITGLSVMAVIAVDLALVQPVWDGRSRWPDAHAIAVLGMMLGQLTLIGVWFVFGRANLAVKSITLIAAQLTGAHVAARCGDGSPSNWSMALAVYLTLVIAALVIMRGARLHFRRPDDGTQQRLGPRQWSIFQLFSMTTAVAVFLGYWTRYSIDWTIVARSALFFGFLALVSVAALWSGFRQRIPTIAALAAALSLLTAYWFRWLDVRGIEQSAMVFLVVVQQAFIHVIALVLRVGGIRLT